jgi:regulator of replication initiation timing
MVADERGLELAVLREDLQAAIFSRHHLIAVKMRTAKRNRSLRRRICDLLDQLASLESHVSELEEETTELRKENEAILSRDDDHQEAFDEKPLSTDDDDHGSDNGDDRDAIMDFYAPETPSEEDPEEVVPHVSGDEWVLAPYPSHVGWRVVVSLSPFAYPCCMVCLEPFGTCVV